MTPRVLISSSGMVQLNLGLPGFSNIIQVGNSRLGWTPIAHLRFARSLSSGRALWGPVGAPGMRMSLAVFLAKMRVSSQRQVTIWFPAPALPAVSPYAPLAASGAPLAGPPAAGARRAQAGVCMTLAYPSVVTDQPSASRNRLVLMVYTAAIFVSALLLFSVQPLFTKMVLPRLGGSPAVWSVAMVFFQSLLLGGYAYAHYLMQLRNRMIPVAAHLVLLIVALLTLPLSIASGWGEPPTSGYAFWLLGLFAVSIGLPFFALAADNPLLQAWFVRTGHPNCPDPYFLYASSNIGSFLALLSYPVLLEPMFTLRSPATAYIVAQIDETDAPAPPWSLRARWIFLAAVPSGLLIAVTAHISTDIAAAPLLWVLLLSLYLLTWVL